MKWRERSDQSFQGRAPTIDTVKRGWVEGGGEAPSPSPFDEQTPRRMRGGCEENTRRRATYREE